jgi:hypothetical protein
MQVIVYETERGVTFTLKNTIDEPTMRVAVLNTFKEAGDFLRTGACPVFSGVPQRGQTFEMLCEFFTHGHAAMGYESRVIHTYLSEHLTSAKKNALPIGDVYNHFVSVTGNTIGMSQPKFTRAVNRTRVFEVRVSTVKGKCTRVICNADFKNC